LGVPNGGAFLFQRTFYAAGKAVFMQQRLPDHLLLRVETLITLRRAAPSIPNRNRADEALIRRRDEWRGNSLGRRISVAAHFAMAKLKQMEFSATTRLRLAEARRRAAIRFVESADVEKGSGKLFRSPEIH
jgi:hypothetical protein